MSAIVAGEPTLYDAVLIGFATREQGLVVASGNPLGFTSLADAVAARRRGSPCGPKGAGAQQLLRGAAEARRSRRRGAAGRR